MNSPCKTQLALEEKILELATDFRSSCVLQGAAALSLFDALDANGSTVEDIAARCKILACSASLLAGILVELGFVQYVDGFYYLSPAKASFLRTGLGNVLKEIGMFQRENAVWLHAAAIFRGEAAPIAYRRELLDSRLAKCSGIQMMNEMLAAEILDAFAEDFADAKSMVDIGGGDGLYAGLILKRNSKILIRIVDLEGGFEMCERHRQHRDDGRLQLVVSDARTFALNAGHDLVMINELLELFSAEEKRMILARAVAALRPGGRIYVTKFDLDRDGVMPAASAVFSLRMRLKTDQSYLETNEEVVRVLADLGCLDIEVHKFAGLKAVIVASAPEASRVPKSHTTSPDVPPFTIYEGKPMLNDGLSQQQVSIWRDIVSVATSFRGAAVLYAAVDLDIFSHVEPGGSSIEDISHAVGIPDVGVKLLAQALAALGLLHYEDGRYWLHPDLRSLLTPGNYCILDDIRHCRRENQVWLNLANILRGDVDARAEAGRLLESFHRHEYLSSVEFSNRLSALQLVEHLAAPIAMARQAMDLGGGLGTYSAALLAANPLLSVTLLDQPEVIAETRKHLVHLASEGRLSLVVGDALNLRLDAMYDLVLISDLLHYFGDEDKLRILAQVERVLLPSGLLVVSKFALDPSGSAPASAVLFSLKVHLKRANAYLEPDVRTAELLRKVGLHDVRIESLDAAKSIVLGVKGHVPHGS